MSDVSASQMRKKQVEGIFNSLDVDGRGAIDEDEFVQLREKSAALDENRLRAIFKSHVR